jgi:hypothetical protein
VKRPTTAEFGKSFVALPKQVHSSLHARHIASSRNTQVIEVWVSKKCIESYESTLLELAKIIEALVSWMEILRSGFELVHRQSTTSCYLTYTPLSATGKMPVPHKDKFSCGTGILPVHKRLIDNGARYQL